jgi:hypothetical protein
MFVCRTMFERMHFVWNNVWCMAIVPILAFGMSGGGLWFFVQVRRDERATDT